MSNDDAVPVPIDVFVARTEAAAPFVVKPKTSNADVNAAQLFFSKRFHETDGAFELATSELQEATSQLRNVKQCIALLEKQIVNLTMNYEACSRAMGPLNSQRDTLRTQAEACQVYYNIGAWIESVFSAPAGNGTCLVNVGLQRYAALAADSRRVDKRHKVYVVRVEIDNIDLSLFANAHTVILNGLERVTDVSGLRDVEHVRLESLPLVADISSLRGVRVLSMYWLPLVTDISSLRGVHALSLQQMHGVTDVSAARGVHTLQLINMPNVADISMLRGVEHLCVAKLPLVTDVSALVACVPTYSISGCKCESVCSGGYESSSVFK